MNENRIHSGGTSGDRPGCLRIGTRGSPLALAQAEEVRARLAAVHPELAAPGACSIVTIATTGDRILDRTLSEVGGKGLFTKEIDEALLGGRIDLAVHSMKDVPTILPAGTALAAVLPREDPRDALIAGEGVALTGIADLPPGCVVGTASLRRQALVLHSRPDVTVVPIRGNVQTRLRKLGAGECSVTILAMAGLNRLGIPETASAPLAVDDMLPAVAQGAIGIAIRDGDGATIDWVAALNHPETLTRVVAERSCLQVLDGSCRTPIAAHAELVEAGHLRLRAFVARSDGTDAVVGEQRAAVADAHALGVELGREIRSRAAPGVVGGRV